MSATDTTRDPTPPCPRCHGNGDTFAGEHDGVPYFKPCPCTKPGAALVINGNHEDRGSKPPRRST